MPEGGELYDEDFFLWTQEQAAALRRAKDSNLPIDWENLAEEIEGLGKSDRRELTSRLRRILRHLFELEASPAPRPRAGWRATIVDARSEIESVLRDSPSLRRQIDWEGRFFSHSNRRPGILTPACNRALLAGRRQRAPCDSHEEKTECSAIL